jgi:high-affinity Fe2+/Pb2+ permease
MCCILCLQNVLWGTVVVVAAVVVVVVFHLVIEFCSAHYFLKTFFNLQSVP